MKWLTVMAEFGICEVEDPVYFYQTVGWHIQCVRVFETEEHREAYVLSGLSTK
jgi:hypothetical protein